MELKEIQALVSSCLEIDPTKRHVLVVDSSYITEAATCTLMRVWKDLTGYGPIILATKGGEGLRIFEIKKEDNHEG